MVEHSAEAAENVFKQKSFSLLFAQDHSDEPPNAIKRVIMKVPKLILKYTGSNGPNENCEVVVFTQTSLLCYVHNILVTCACYIVWLTVREMWLLQSVVQCL